MIWHSSDASSVLSQLRTDAEHGLSTDEAIDRLKTYGKNTTALEGKGLFSRFLNQLNNKVVYFLIAVSLVSLVVNLIYSPQDFYFSLLIIAIVIINAFISAFHLHKCDEALNDIQNAATPNVNVIRDGRENSIPSDELVPGDIIVLRQGDYITADARLIKSDALRCNESVISGEIVPVEKSDSVIVEDISSASERKNMVFSGCSVIHGEALAVVVETGLRTEIGKLTDISRQTNSDTLPITETLNTCNKILNIAIFIVCIITFLIGLFQNFNSHEPFASITVSALMNAVALGICAIPESLPAISTIVIALGIQRMINDHVVVKNTKALELMGKTEVFCVDKTGIITKNNMVMSCIYDGENLVELTEDALPEKAAGVLQLAVSCSMLENDATETAIETACKKYLSMSKTDVSNILPRLSSIPFDSVRKTMTSINMISGSPFAIVKGAPEILLEKCALHDKDAVVDIYNKLTLESYRVLCIAIKKLDEIPASPNPDDIEQNLTFVGLLGIYDPPQSDTVDAIDVCKIAGIRTIMMTGDNIVTAKSIARRIGILTDDSQAITGVELDKLSDQELTYSIENYSVYARISPEDKLRIIKAWQSRGKVVAVTGNGSEDADALLQADIGCAVGNFGTDIAKGNADVIVENKKFMSVVDAIRESRGLFENVKKAVNYLLSCNFGEVLAFVAGMLIFGMPPLAAVQLLWINLLTDCTSVISLTVEKSEFNVMRQKPLTLSGHLFSKNSIINIACDTLVIAVLTLISFGIGSSTMAFVTLSTLEIFHSFNFKSQHTLFKTDFKSNRFMNYSTVITLFICIFLVHTPAGYIFGLSVLTFRQFAYSVLLALAILPYSEIKKLIMKQIKSTSLMSF